LSVEARTVNAVLTTTPTTYFAETDDLYPGYSALHALMFILYVPGIVPAGEITLSTADPEAPKAAVTVA
jgi:hypothetical protein